MQEQEERWLLESFGGEKSFAFFTALTRLHSGEPLAYIIGSIPFLDCTIFLDNRPLIPRTETEFWVEKAIASIKTTAGKPTHILDLCAGSGCIGVAVANALPNCMVNFAEIDSALLPTIEKNCIENDISPERYTLYASDLFTSLPKNTRYDFILSNPPYIDPRVDRAEQSVKTYEPSRALYGGEDGLTLISRIIEEAPAFLSPKGQLWIEHEPEQVKAVQRLAAKRSFAATTHPDQYGIKRYTVMVKY